MAASGFTPISLYYSTTAAAVPTSGNLANGELGLNIADMKLYAKNSAGTVTLLASNAGATGSVTSVSGTGTVNGLTLTGTVTSTGSLTLGGTLSLVSPPPIGSTTPNTGAFTTLSATRGSAGVVATLLSGNSAQSPYITFGRSAEDVRIQIAAATNDLFTGTVAGDYATNSNGSIWFGSGGNPITKISSTGLTLSTTSNTTASIIAGGLNSNNGIIQLGSSGVAYQILGGAYQGNMNLFTGAGGGPIIFTPNNAERARITLGLSVGTTSDPGAGAIYATGNITAFFSDKRLKTVSGKIENALDKVAQLSGVYYTFNDTAKSFGYDSDEEHVGVIAQEVEAVLPQIVKAAPFDLDENNNSKSGENYKTVQYDKLVPLLIEAINELTAKIKVLEAK